MTEENNEILGRWTTDPNDINSLENFGKVTLVFDKDDLTYIIHSKKKDEFILLKYKIAGDFLITTQPSMAKGEEEVTNFRFINPTILILEYQGVKSQYIKVSRGS